MRYVRLIAAIVGLALVMIARPAFASDAPAPTMTVPAGPANLRARTVTETTMTSRDGKAYNILISTPDGPPPPGGFPVIYVLDGHGWFGAAVEIARMRENSKLDPPIIVGVGYPSRRFFDPGRSLDLTPPGVADARFEPGEIGGADRFLSFLNETLKPTIAAAHPINAERETLFGHSFGGLFALYALFHAPQSFDVYIAASPSVGFGDRAILREAAAFRPGARGSPRLLVTMGGLEAGLPAALMADYRRWYEAHPEARGGLGVDEIMAETFPPADAAFDRIGAARAMTEQLAAAGLPATFAVFPDEEHTAAGISALNRGVPLALRPAG